MPGYRGRGTVPVETFTGMASVGNDWRCHNVRGFSTRSWVLSTLSGTPGASVSLRPMRRRSKGASPRRHWSTRRFEWPPTVPVGCSVGPGRGSMRHGTPPVCAGAALPDSRDRMPRVAAPPSWAMCRTPVRRSPRMRAPRPTTTNRWPPWIPAPSMTSGAMKPGVPITSPVLVTWLSPASSRCRNPRAQDPSPKSSHWSA